MTMLGGLERHVLEKDAVIPKRREDGVEDVACDSLGVFEGMRTFHQNIGFHNGQDALLLTDRRVIRRYRKMKEQ